MDVSTACTGDNADLIGAAARLYLHDGATVADITYGKGVFWRHFRNRRFMLCASDLHSIPPKQRDFGEPFMIKADFCRLPYTDDTFDIVVFDPPYMHNPGKHMTDARYRNLATTKGMYHRDIIALYADGMREALRVAKVAGGQLWVKCKDEIEGGIQRWSHIEVYNIAIGLGLFARDLFILVPTSKTSPNRWKRQFHARKTHSYLWIFERPKKADRAGLVRAGILTGATIGKDDVR